MAWSVRAQPRCPPYTSRGLKILTVPSQAPVRRAVRAAGAAGGGRTGSAGTAGASGAESEGAVGMNGGGRANVRVGGTNGWNSGSLELRAEGTQL
jgi:hypothetical protein